MFLVSASIVAVCCTVAGPAAAPSPAGPVAVPETPAVPMAPPEADLAALLREALDASPAIRAAAARAASARRLPDQAEASPDPEVSIAYVNDGVSSFTLGDTEFSNLALTWTQEVPYPGKRRGSAQVARAAIEMADRELDRLRFATAADVKSGYAELYRLDRTADLLQETRSILASLAQAARSRYEVGQGIQESIFKAQTAIVRLQAEAERVMQDRIVAAARLNAALGRATDPPIGRATRLPDAAMPPDAATLADAAVAASPEIRRLEAAVRRAIAGEDRARLDLKPDFVWSAGYQYRGSYDPMVMGMFGLRLPLHRDRKQAMALAQAGADLQVARLDLADLQVRTRAAVREWLAQAERAGRLMALYEQGIIPQAQGALESARTSYGVGRIAFLDLLNDALTLLEARTELGEQEADRIKALAAIEPLVGRVLVPVPGFAGIEADTEGGADDSHR
jgi:outer membrane protein TolC